jgi:hypothetical protein
MMTVLHMAFSQGHSHYKRCISITYLHGAHTCI